MFCNETILEFCSSSVEETKAFGKKLASFFKKNQVFAFMGNLGSGKTSLIKGIVGSINGGNQDDVCSPTFNYLNVYSGEFEIYHFDLYRIKNENHFVAMGFDEYFTKEGVCLIEWSERIIPILPPESLIVHILEKERTDERKIVVLKL